MRRALRIHLALALALSSHTALAEAPSSPASAAAGAQVHVEAPTDLTLFRQVDGPGARDGAPTPVCEAPCDQTIELRADYRYFVDGPGVTRSGTFALDEGAWNVAVDPGSSAQRYAGIPITVLGGVGTVVGAALMVGRAFDDGYDESLVLGGGISLGIGLAAVATGIVLMATSGTSVDVARIAEATTLRF